MTHEIANSEAKSRAHRWIEDNKLEIVWGIASLNIFLLIGSSKTKSLKQRDYNHIDITTPINNLKD